MTERDAHAPARFRRLRGLLPGDRWYSVHNVHVLAWLAGVVVFRAVWTSNVLLGLAGGLVWAVSLRVCNHVERDQRALEQRVQKLRDALSALITTADDLIHPESPEVQTYHACCPDDPELCDLAALRAAREAVWND